MNNIFTNKRFSVSTKLNIVNVLVIISGFLSILGAYEIQLGGKMHELNYFHQKYITSLIKTVDNFEKKDSSITDVEKNILLIREQPIKCLELTGVLEKTMMKLIGTYDAITACNNDIVIANNLLDKVTHYREQKIAKRDLIHQLHIGVKDFEDNGVLFEPLIGKTVAITFAIVIAIIIGKAVVIPVFGLILSSSVSKDYQLLEKTKKNLEEANRKNELIQEEKMASLSTLSAGIAHEINTPIGASITANSYAKELVDNLYAAYKKGELTERAFVNFFDKVKTSNKIIEESLFRTSTLIDSFKRISEDQSLNQYQALNIKPYIEQLLLSLTPITKKKDVDIIIDCPDEYVVEVCPGSLSQLITNLITNAIKHGFKETQTGTVNIKITKHVGSISIVFSDNGCGIDKKHLPHIFDPFFTTARGSGGTGLGLHILHQLVTTKLNGKIRCMSEHNKGTTFEINIPDKPCA